MRSYGKKPLDNSGTRLLEDMAKRCRGDILTMTTLSGSGHPGGSMSSIEIFLSVYSFADISPEDPFDRQRDRVVVSHGHTSPGVYAALGRLGFIDIEEAIAGFRHPGTVFEGHITRGIPGIEWTTGNLGQGLSAGVGMALGSRLLGNGSHVYVVMGDAEQAKGQVAEARRTAIKLKLKNITAIIDYNDAQISGKASEIMPVNIEREYEASGWRVRNVDGHSIVALWEALLEAEEGPPTVIIARTKIGKGVSFMEDEIGYHGVTLSEKQYIDAMSELSLEPTLEEYRKSRRELQQSHVRPDIDNYVPDISMGVPRGYSEKTDNRSAVGKAILDLVKANPDVPMFAVDCDLLGSVKLDFLAKEHPERIVELGVQEHNAATLSGSLSTCGIVPFFADFGMFGIDEVYNQQRLNAINKTNLKLICTHVGIDVGEDGKTHHCIDYVGAMNNLFGWELIAPGDPNQTDRAVRYSASMNGNVLIAVGRSKIPIVTDEHGEAFYDADYVFEYGKIDQIRTGADFFILSYGQLLHRAVKVSDELRKEGIFIGVVNIPCPSEPDVEAILSVIEDNNVIVYEDHNWKTGLFAVLSRICTEHGRFPARMISLGIDDYALSGPAEMILETSKISENDLRRKIIEMRSQ